MSNDATEGALAPANAFINASTDGQRLVISDEDTRDDAQVSGRWVSVGAGGVCEVQR